MINLRSRAWRSLVTSILLAFEGSVILSLDIYLIIQNFIADNIDDRHALLGEIIYATGGAVVLFLLAWGFYKEKRAQRSPAILLNLIFIGVSSYMLSEGLMILGIVTFVISAATVAMAVSVIPEKK